MTPDKLDFIVLMRKYGQACTDWGEQPTRTNLAIVQDLESEFIHAINKLFEEKA